MSVAIRITPSDINLYLSAHEPDGDKASRFRKSLYNAEPSPELDDYLTENGIRIAVHAAGVTEKMISTATKRYGDDTIRLLQEDPFELIGPVPALTFDMALALWRRLSPEPYARKRVAIAAVNEQMNILKNSGSIFISRMALVNGVLSRTLVPQVDIDAAISALLHRAILVADNKNGSAILVRADALRTERIISTLLLQRNSSQEPPDYFSILIAMTEAGIASPDDDQIAAVASALSHSASLITGGPGTGKSTIQAAIARLFISRKPDARVKLVSLAARVARAIGAKTGIDADTIHATLGVLPGEGFTHGVHNPLQLDLLIVEEAFMIGNQLLADLLLAVPNTCTVVFVGDPEQLPPVMAGTPIQAVLAAGVLPGVRLNTNHRSSARDIPAAAKRIMAGRPLAETENVKIVRYDTTTDAISRIRAEFIKSTEGGHTTQILTAMHNGALGTQAINRVIAGHTKISSGDLVMQTVNDREANFFNGEIAIVLDIDASGARLKKDDGVIIQRSRSQIKDLVQAWAITYHKAQGLEYDTVILVVSPNHTRMLGRNLINVGLTRAKRRCIIVEHQNALPATLSKDLTSARHTLLKRLLQGDRIGAIP